MPLMLELRPGDYYRFESECIFEVLPKRKVRVHSKHSPIQLSRKKAGDDEYTEVIFPGKPKDGAE